MKKIILLLLLVSSFTVIYAQDYFMYVGGEKRYFEISPNEMLMQFVENTEISTVKSIMGLKVSGISETGYKGWCLVSFLGTDKTKIMELMKNKNKNEVLFCGVIFIDEYGEKKAALTNQIIVRLKDEDDVPILQKSIEAYKIDDVRQDEFENKTYLLKMNYSSEKDAMQIANELYETGLFEYAEPDLMLFIKYGTNDTYFPDQWGLNNTGQYGGTADMDIKVTQAWTITTGNPNIKIAILDTGVDLGHPDLIENLLQGYDATAGGNNNGNHMGDPHGTACAGIAAARGNNSNGIAGVAYNCRILPVYLGHHAYASDVIKGLDWARLNGANVISMSIAGITETVGINTAITNAYSSGCVLVGATGNTNRDSVNYPARHPNVIAVGAISPCGERKSFSSCDGEYWGSHYGNGLSVVAPGVLISTTDIQGDAGLNNSDKLNDYSDRDYTQWFFGTSAATPHVAGVAALILSVNPNLTGQQVRDIIEKTAQELPNHPPNEPSRPNWNNEVGYGLVNAYEAVLAAQATISGPDTICHSGIYTLNNGTAASWSVTPSNVFTFPSRSTNINSTTVKSYSVAGASGTLTTVTTTHGITVTKTIHSCQASISGSDILCANANSTYTLTGIPSGLTISNTSWTASNGITLTSPTLQSVSARNTTVPLIVATYPLPPVVTSATQSGSISATVTINNVTSVISSKELTLPYHPAGTIIGPMNVGGNNVVIPSQPGYYKFTVGTDVPSNADVRWVAAPVNSSNPNATADLYTGRTANIYLNWGDNEIRMQYSEGCINSNPAVMRVAGGYRGGTDTTTHNELNVQLSPNPVTNSLNVTVEDDTPPIDVTVYSSSGTLYLSQTFSTSTFTIDLSRCQPGMLVVRISCGSKHVVKNILKQ